MTIYIICIKYLLLPFCDSVIIEYLIFNIKVCRGIVFCRVHITVLWSYEVQHQLSIPASLMIIWAMQQTNMLKLLHSLT